MRVEKYNEIYPFIRDFVDTFYTENINKFINNSVEQPIDKNTMLMYIAMYFMTYLKIDDHVDKKFEIIETMNNVVCNPEERQKFIEMFNSVGISSGERTIGEFSDGEK